MASRKDILLDGIKRMRRLHLNRQQIVAQLSRLGISGQEGNALLDEAKDLIAETKKIASGQLEERQGPAAAGREKAKGACEGKKGRIEGILRTIGAAGNGKHENNLEKQLATEEKTAAALEKDRKLDSKNRSAKGVDVPKPKKKQSVVPEEETVSDVARLWEKGILVAVDNKLNEMRSIKEELDKELAVRIEKASQEHMKKAQVLFDSQKTLITQSVNASLEKKAQGLEKIIDEKLKEMKEINRSIKDSIEALEKRSSEEKGLSAELREEINRLDEARASIIAQANAEILKQQSKSQEVTDAMKGKVSEIDERVNKTLALESKIVDGLAEDAKAKLKSFNLADTGELNRKLEEELERIQETRLALDSQVKEKLSTLERLIATFKETYGEEAAKRSMAELEAFKAQFLKMAERTMEKNRELQKQLEKKLAQTEKGK